MQEDHPQPGEQAIPVNQSSFVSERLKQTYNRRAGGLRRGINFALVLIPHMLSF